MIIKYANDFFGYPQANTLSDINITREDIIGAIKTISQNSCGGPDEFPAIILKQCCKRKAHPLLLLDEESLKTGEVPIDLKLASITPIYKGDSRNLPKNYRPVAVTSHLIKILEKILAKYIHKFPKCITKWTPSNMASVLADLVSPSYRSNTTRYYRNWKSRTMLMLST